MYMCGFVTFLSLLSINAQKCPDFVRDYERENQMSDQVGASSSAKAQAVNNFNTRLVEFEQASQHINTAVSELAHTWKGAGYQAFVSAMDKWRKDMESVSTDLQHLSEATSKSDEHFQNLDQQISRAFSGF